MTTALWLPTSKLSDDEISVLGKLTNQLSKYRPENQGKEQYYDAKAATKDLKIAIPPSLQGLEVAVGWPAAAVDCVEERLDFEGWNYGDAKKPASVRGRGSSEDPWGLDELYRENDLDVESSKVHLDALIYGVGFVAVTTGIDGEPDPLITVESPLNMTAIIDPRTRMVRAAYMQKLDIEDKVAVAALMLPNETIWLESIVPSAGGIPPGGWRIVNRDRHNLNRVCVAPFINMPQSGSVVKGHSEITETVRRLTQAGMRTLANAEVAREFYAAPQRFVLGAKESFFVDSDGTPLPAWKSYLGRMLALERDEFGDVPDVKEFRGQGLDTFFGMMKMYAQLLSGHVGIPQNYLGFATDNPPSAEALNAMEARLIKRAERRQRWFGRGWSEVARLAIVVQNGLKEIPSEARSIRPRWRPAHTPTVAAQADATTKLIAAGVLSAQSKVTWDRLDISRAEQKQLEADLRKQSVTSLVEGLTPAASKVSPDVAAAVLKQKKDPAKKQDPAKK
jgi:hypothetical protein